MRVLIAEDDRISRKLIQTTLVKWGYEVVVCEQGAQALEILLGPDAPRLAILDWMMPGMDGVEVCRRVRGRHDENYTYIILLTALNQKEDVVRGMEAGADDYVPKPFHAHELRVRLHAGRRILQLQSELIKARDALHFQATHDSLTGMLNHASILDVLDRELARSRREDSDLSIVLTDVDHFKQVNDEHGHLIGDSVLTQVSRAIRAAVRPYDAVGRYGGEEFLVISPGANGSGVLKVAERLRHEVASRETNINSTIVRVTISLGTAGNRGCRDIPLGTLVEAADAALYRAKEAGRNRVESARPSDYHLAQAPPLATRAS